MLITIYTICYNEAFMLPHFIAHYRRMFPRCHIIVYDNESTDNTRDIAMQGGCEVRSYCTGNQLSDSAYLRIKNNCWKDAKTDWVLIADTDELCDINHINLEYLTLHNITIPVFEGYNMVNLNDDMNFEGITHGVRAPDYDKSYLFNKIFITEINYVAGCHVSTPHGYVDQGKKAKFICRHYKYINPDYMVTRHGTFIKRMCPENRKNGWGSHYAYTEEKIRNAFNDARTNAIHII